MKVYSTFKNLNKHHKSKEIVTGAILIVFIVSGIFVIYSFLQNNTRNINRENKIVNVQRQRLSALEATVKQKANDPQARRNYAVALYATGDLEKAKEQYLAEIKLNRNDPVAFNNLGNIYRDQGSSDEAIKAYKQAIELNPNNPTGYLNLGHFYIYSGKTDLGIGVYKDALEKNPGNTDIQIQLALVYEQSGKSDKALEIYKTILTDSHDNPAALTGLSRIEKSGK